MTDPTADAAKLLPCPWCATPPLGSPLNNALEPKRSMYLLQCPSGKCPVRPKVYGSDQADAERRWNTRPQPAPPEGEPDWINIAREIEGCAFDTAPQGKELSHEQYIGMLASWLKTRLGLTARPKVEDALRLKANNAILDGAEEHERRIEAEARLVEADSVIAFYHEFDHYEGGRSATADEEKWDEEATQRHVTRQQQKEDNCQ